MIIKSRHSSTFIIQGEVHVIVITTDAPSFAGRDCTDRIHAKWLLFNIALLVGLAIDIRAKVARLLLIEELLLSNLRLVRLFEPLLTFEQGFLGCVVLPLLASLVDLGLFLVSVRFVHINNTTILILNNRFIDIL